MSYDNKTCIDDCSKTKYKYYVEGLYYCIDKCPEGYYIDRSDSDDIESYKCVLSCSNKDDYLKYYENLKKYKCVDISECSDYIIENNKTCVKKCDGEYPFYKKVGEASNQKKICISDCDFLLPGGECKSACDEETLDNGNKYYNIENKTCLKECPEDKMVYQYQCYSKCPEEAIYSDGTLCTNNCPSSSESNNCFKS